MTKAAERAGKPDVGELVRQGRLKYNATRGLDPNPNPEIGQVPNPDTGMRAGMTPEKYHKLVLLSERRRRMNKEWDFIPELEDHEFDIYLAWLKSGGPKKMKAAGRELARSQSTDVMQLIKKYDPENAARIAAIPTNPGAQMRDSIGGSSLSEEMENAAEDVETPEAAEIEEGGDEGEAEGLGEADVAPESGVAPIPEAPEGYDAVDPDAEEKEPAVVSAPRRRRGPNRQK